MKTSIHQLAFIFCLSLSLFLLKPLSVFSEEIVFETITFEEALKKAEDSKKLIFVDAYTTWCGPCKWMAKNVFTDTEVAKFYTENFICLKIDMEKGEGKTFAERYQVHSYPTFVFLNGAGEKVHQVCGSKEAEAFLLDGKNALTPETQLLSYQKRFNSGDRDFGFLRDYARTLAQANMDNEEVVINLISSDRRMELISKSDFELLANGSDMHSKSFEFVVDMREKYLGVLDKGTLNDYFTQVFLDEAYTAGKTNNPDLLDEARKTAMKCINENVQKLKAEMNWRYAKAAKTGMLEAAQAYADEYLKEDSQELNNISWAIYENYSDTKSLTAAASWAERSVKLAEDYANTDTYANILFKLGNYSEAAKYAKSSIAIAKKQNLDCEATENLLKEIEAKSKSKK